MIKGEVKSKVLQSCDVSHSFVAIRDVSGVAESSLAKFLGELASDGYVEKKEGKYYLTELGKKMVKEIKEQTALSKRIGGVGEITYALSKEMGSVLFSLGYLESHYERRGLFREIFKRKESIAKRVALARMKSEIDVFLTLAKSIFVPLKSSDLTNEAPAFSGDFATDFDYELRRALEVMEKIRVARPEQKEMIDTATSYLDVALLQVDIMKKKLA